MWLNSYQETVLHDKDTQWWWESSVFGVKYPDGRQECIKEYGFGIDYDLLKDYHVLHNYLSQYSSSYDVTFPFNDQNITKLSFTVIPLGNDIAKATSLSSQEEICISTVPYVGWYGFDEVARTWPDAMRFLCKKLDQFAQDVCTTYPDVFTTPEFLTENLCSVNMKCFVEGNEMKILITDLFGRIRQLYEVCDEVQLGLLNILQDRKVL